MSNILNLDRILAIFFGKRIFTELDYNDNREKVDVRSFEEFKSMPLLQYNIPIINKEEHTFLYKHKYLSAAIVFYGLFKRRRDIKLELMKVSQNKEKKILLACSKGRLRSPAMWLYAKFLGIDAKILKHGIKYYNKN